MILIEPSTTLIYAYLAATRALDFDALISTFGPDAVLTDGGRDYSGAELWYWAKNLYIGSNVSIELLSASFEGEDAELRVRVDGDYVDFNIFEPSICLWSFHLANGKIASLKMIELKPLAPEPLYEAAAWAMGDGAGATATLDGNFSVKLALPNVLGAAGREGTSPEQLFAASYAAGFLNSLKLAALRERIAFSPDAAVTATVGVGRREKGGLGLTVALAVSLSGIATEVAAALTKKAHATCPYSNAVRGNIRVSFSVI